MALLALPAYAAGPKLSKGVNNALADEQKAYTAGDYKTAADDIAKARAVDGRTPEDDYWINKIDINVEIKSNNMAAADQDAEAAADSPAMPPEDKTEMLRLALILANNQKHTDKAVTYAKATAGHKSHRSGRDQPDHRGLFQRQGFRRRADPRAKAGRCGCRRWP